MKVTRHKVESRIFSKATYHLPEGRRRRIARRNARRPAGLAQLAEQLTCNQQVIGSIPIPGSRALEARRLPTRSTRRTCDRRYRSRSGRGSGFQCCPPPRDLVARERGRGRDVERRDRAAHRDRHQHFAPSTRQSRQASSFGAEHQHEWLIRELEIEERSILGRYVEPDGPAPGRGGRDRVRSVSRP